MYDKLGLILDGSILQRAARILNDYSTMYWRFRPHYYARDVDINDVLKAARDRISSCSLKDDEILNAKYHEEFLSALRSRIAHVNVFERADIEILEDKSLPYVRMDTERFIEALMDLLERFCGSDRCSIKIVPALMDGWVSIRVVLSKEKYVQPLDPRSMRFLERAFSSCGGIIQSHVFDTTCVVEIEFLPCGFV